MGDMQEAVRRRYAKAIALTGESNRKWRDGSGISGMVKDSYDGEMLDRVPKALQGQSFGCGNPVRYADLRPGETVLDLGCGAGLDLFLASEAVGSSGKAIGLDMTDAMLQKAEENLHFFENISLVKGYIENIPLQDEFVDVVLSNCVVTLSPDKSQVFREIFRVLRPDGRISIADTVFTRTVSKRTAECLSSWSPCTAGSLHEEEYLSGLREVGFRHVRLHRITVFPFPEALSSMAFPELTEGERQELDGCLASAVIVGKKPAHDPEAKKRDEEGGPGQMRTTAEP